MNHLYNAEAIIRNYYYHKQKLFLVWSCKTLKNWKAIYACPREKMLYEVTYNGEKQEYYVDFYTKTTHLAVEANYFAKQMDADFKDLGGGENE